MTVIFHYGVWPYVRSVFTHNGQGKKLLQRGVRIEQNRIIHLGISPCQRISVVKIWIQQPISLTFNLFLKKSLWQSISFWRVKPTRNDFSFILWARSDSPYSSRQVSFWINSHGIESLSLQRHTCKKLLRFGKYRSILQKYVTSTTLEVNCEIFSHGKRYWNDQPKSRALQTCCLMGRVSKLDIFTLIHPAQFPPAVIFHFRILWIRDRRRIWIKTIKLNLERRKKMHKS